MHFDGYFTVFCFLLGLCTCMSPVSCDTWVPPSCDLDDCQLYCEFYGRIYGYCDSLGLHCRCSLDSIRQGCPEDEVKCNRYCQKYGRKMGNCGSSGKTCWCSIY